MYAFAWTGCPSSAARAWQNLSTGGQVRCRACRTSVDPSANSRVSRSSLTWSPIPAPTPPGAVNDLSGERVRRPWRPGGTASAGRGRRPARRSRRRSASRRTRSRRGVTRPGTASRGGPSSLRRTRRVRSRRVWTSTADAGCPGAFPDSRSAGVSVVEVSGRLRRPRHRPGRRAPSSAALCASIGSAVCASIERAPLAPPSAPAAQRLHRLRRPGRRECPRLRRQRHHRLRRRPHRRARRVRPRRHRRPDPQCRRPHRHLRRRRPHRLGSRRCRSHHRRPDPRDRLLRRRWDRMSRSSGNLPDWWAGVSPTSSPTAYTTGPSRRPAAPNETPGMSERGTSIAGVDGRSPDLTHSLANEAIIAMAGPEAFARAQVYVRDGHVTGLEFDADRRIVSGRVKGSHHASYATSIQLAGGPSRSPAHRGRCSCPIGVDCKHAAAVLIAARGLPAITSQLGRAEWERSLGRLAAAAEPVREPEDVRLGAGVRSRADPGLWRCRRPAATPRASGALGEQRPLDSFRGRLGAAGLPGQRIPQRAARPAAAALGVRRRRRPVRLSAQPVARAHRNQPESVVGAGTCADFRARARHRSRHRRADRGDQGGRCRPGRPPGRGWRHRPDPGRPADRPARSDRTDRRPRRTGPRSVLVESSDRPAGPAVPRAGATAATAGRRAAYARRSRRSDPGAVR